MPADNCIRPFIKQAHLEDESCIDRLYCQIVLESRKQGEFRPIGRLDRALND